MWKLELIERDNWRYLAEGRGFRHQSRLGPRFRGDDEFGVEARRALQTAITARTLLPDRVRASV